MDVDIVPPTLPVESPPVVTLPDDDEVEAVEPTNVVACTPAAGALSAAACPSGPTDGPASLSLHRHTGPVT
jgi:hypothetical protein